jgi:hypothetical protein
MAGENWTFWLNMTNFALGMVTVVAVVLVFSAVGWDLLVRKVHTARAPRGLDLSSLDGELRAMLQGSHSMYEPGLGLTMADGGEKIEPEKPAAPDEKHEK